MFLNLSLHLNDSGGGLPCLQCSGFSNAVTTTTTTFSMVKKSLVTCLNIFKNNLFASHINNEIEMFKSGSITCSVSCTTS